MLHSRSVFERPHPSPLPQAGEGVQIPRASFADLSVKPTEGRPFADLPLKPTEGRGFTVCGRDPLTPTLSAEGRGGIEGCGVTVCDRDGLGLATVLARRDKNAALAQRVREQFGIELPQGPHRSTAGDLALAGTGPGAWLATHENGPSVATARRVASCVSSNAFAVSLREAIGDLASVSDQSDSYAVLRLSGPSARDTLRKLVPVDVHPRAFKINDVAATVAAHIDATLWRLEDDAHGSPVFEIAIFRSFAASFWQALSESAAEFGFGVAQS